MTSSSVGESSREVARVGIRLLDDAHASWCAAQIQCQQALSAWFSAAPSSRAAANIAYRAALDREEAAARDLERLWSVASVREGYHLTEPRQLARMVWDRVSLAVLGAAVSRRA